MSGWMCGFVCGCMNKRVDGKMDTWMINSMKCVCILYSSYFFAPWNQKDIYSFSERCPFIVQDFFFLVNEE